MKEVSTSAKLKVIKEVFATCLVNANELSIIEGLVYRYKSEPIEVGGQKGWCIQLMVKEAGYGEKVLQEFNFQRPNNIDAKNIEYHALVQVMTYMMKDTLGMWYKLGMMLASDKDLQKQAKESFNGESENNISQN